MRDKDLPRNHRIVLAFNMFLWRIAWIGPFVTLWNFLSGGSALPEWAALSAAVLTGFVGMVYMLGAYRNIIGTGIKFRRQFYIWVLTGLLVPVATAVEGIAVLYSIIRPIKTFEVVNKN
jgi:hypothetical protein